MALNEGQKAKVNELQEIAKIAGVDFWNLEHSTDGDDVKDIVLELAHDRIVRADVVYQYVLIDELLSDLICRIFFDPNKTSFELWETREFKIFNYHVLENLPLIRKVALVKEAYELPRAIEEIITLTNVVRNAMAHSFFPMNKREFKRTGKVTYKGKDIHTLEGFRLFDADGNRAIGHLSYMLYGVPEPEGKPKT